MQTQQQKNNRESLYNVNLYLLFNLNNQKLYKMLPSLYKYAFNMFTELEIFQ